MMRYDSFRGQPCYKSVHFGCKRLWVILMSYVNCVCYVALSAVPSVYNTALQKHIGYNWVGIFGSVAIIATNSRRTMYCMIVQRPMYVKQCPGILECVQNCASWEILIYFFHSLHPLASHTLVCRHWIKMTYIDVCDIPFPHQPGPSWHVVADWQGLCSRVWVPEGWGSPGDRRRGNECRGDQHALGACWALRVLLDLCERCFLGQAWRLPGE